MATKTRSLGTANDGLVAVTLTYDDASRAVQSLTLRNDGVNGTMTATLYDRTTHAIVFGPATRAFGTGTVVDDLSGLGLQMVAVTPDKFSPDGLATPFGYSLNWSS